jgi:hypothetical protein
MQKFICSFGMGTPLAGKFLEVEAEDINHCSNILRDRGILELVSDMHSEVNGRLLIQRHSWHKLPDGKAAYANLDQVDWEALRDQKGVLVGLAGDRGSITKEQQEALNGIIHLLDHIQDEAAIGLGEDTVFGKLEV